MQTFTPLPLDGLTPEQVPAVVRLNCLGSLFYFIKIGLRRKRLTHTLHLPVCRFLEREHIKDLLEMPRDHFKTTICTEGKPIWAALPFTAKDEDSFRKLGYDDAFIRWMNKAHDQDTRQLLISENVTNAAKLGTRIRRHYESNGVFRSLFPEILPDTSCKWTDFSLVHRRRKGGSGSAHGEGTYDFLGVGSALQSRHYTGQVVQDDLVGRKAVESPSIMDKTWDYHQLVIGAFEDEDKDHEGNELVVGNRWAFHDVNSRIRSEEPWFNITTHSAMGGCCDLHPPNQPIFPEEFSAEKLERIKRRLGAYKYSCQFLNNPSSPEDADFQAAWLNYYKPVQWLDGTWFIVHEVKDGNARKDVKLGYLAIAMVVDPAHSGNAARGRCRHAIIVLGQSQDNHFYLLDTWAQACGYQLFFEKIFEIAKKWKIRKVGFETVAAQKFAAYHIQTMNATKDWKISIQPLEGEVDVDGELTRKKEWRIRNVLTTIFEQERFWVQRNKHQSFIEEYETFPRGRFVDQLDATAYAPQLMQNRISEQDNLALLAANKARANRVNAPYSVRVN